MEIEKMNCQFSQKPYKAKFSSEQTHEFSQLLNRLV